MIYLVNPFSGLKDLGVVRLCFERLLCILLVIFQKVILVIIIWCTILSRNFYFSGLFVKFNLVLLDFILVIIIWCTILSRNFYFRDGLSEPL
jgi:hypothetical protein